MRTVVFFCALLWCGEAVGQAQTRSLDSAFAKERKSVIGLQLYRANRAFCAGTLDCYEATRGSAQAGVYTPCLSDAMGCHIGAEISPHAKTWGALGGAKISATVGEFTVGLGRHTDTRLLSRRPFLEGTYRLDSETSVHVGVIRLRSPEGSRPMGFILLKQRF